MIETVCVLLVVRAEVEETIDAVNGTFELGRLPGVCRLRDKFRIRTRVGTLIVATIYLQLIQNRYMFRSFTVLQCSHQHCVQPVAGDVES